MKELSNYKKRLFASIIITSLGVVLTNTADSSIGIVLIAVGGLFLISAFAKKKEEEASDKQE